MKYRILGRTRLEVSEIGLGGAGIGGVWGGITFEEARQTVFQAQRVGVNFFDVAPSYGAGMAEQVLGSTLRGRIEGTIIATKVKLNPDELGDIRQNTIRSVDASLLRLQRTSVNLIQIHNKITKDRGDRPGSITVDDALEMVQAFKELRKVGKARFFGFTAWDGDPAGLRQLIETSDFDTIQVLYNMLNTSAQKLTPPGLLVEDQGQIISLAAERNLGIIGIRPLAAGALTEVVEVGRDISASLKEELRRAETLPYFGAGSSIDLPQTALQFCLMNPHLATTIPGCKGATEITASAASSDAGPLPTGVGLG